MGYNENLFFRGQPTRVMPGDRLIVYLEDSSVTFERRGEHLSIQPAKGVTTDRYPHHGEKRPIPGMRHVHLASDIAREVDLRLTMLSYTQDRAVYEFSV